MASEETKITSGSLIAAEKVEGTDVYNMQGEKLGTVDDIMLDKVSGKAIYAIMSFGGFLGIGEKYHPLPWSTLKYGEVKGGYVVNLDKQILEGAPSYGMNEDFRWTADYGRQVDKSQRRATGRPRAIPAGGAAPPYGRPAPQGIPGLKGSVKRCRDRFGVGRPIDDGDRPLRIAARRRVARRQGPAAILSNPLCSAHQAVAARSAAARVAAVNSLQYLAFFSIAVGLSRRAFLRNRCAAGTAKDRFIHTDHFAVQHCRACRPAHACRKSILTGRSRRQSGWTGRPGRS